MALMVLRKKKKERKFAVAGSEPPLSFFRLFFVKDVRQRSVVCVRGQAHFSVLKNRYRKAVIEARTFLQDSRAKRLSVFLFLHICI